MFVEQGLMSKQDVDEVGDILLKAAADIEMNGWCKHSFFDNGASCAEGAIMRAVGRSLCYTYEDKNGVAQCGVSLPGYLERRAHDRLLKYVNLPLVDMVRVWNDIYAKSEWDVVQTMREAAYAK